ncbi:MAG: UDP-N-acetyl-D-glucosamine dehydrogenase [Bacteroidetes bacterium SW_9_63_38]|nr:MAG: UDP-N-acetyl-D-glucosamine dehydrogenase [Bacteroidetes bacterium SW_9_63_38]
MDFDTAFASSLATNGAVPEDVDQSPAAQQLARRLETKTATIGVVGLGYVGLPLAVEYADQGFSTIGIDLDEERVGQLNAGDNYLDDLDDARVRCLVQDEVLESTATYADSGDIDVFFICVPTPVTDTNEPDTSYIEGATASIAEHLRPGQLVVLKSTTYPDTTGGVVQPILEEAAQKKGLTLGEDYFLAHSPERIDPGNEEYTTANTPIVAGGVTEACTHLTKKALEQIVSEVHAVSNPKVSEMEKLLENIFRSVNIALVNELAQLCDRIGEVSMWEVVQAASTKPFGFMPFYPGPGLGGHCIPIDPHYLSWLARKHDFETSFITLSARINEGMPFYVAESIIEAIARQPVQLSNASVLVLGVAFKRNVDDTRHSPAGPIIRQLQEKGIDTIRYHDPHVPEYHVNGTEQTTMDVPRAELTPETLEAHDATVIVTDHDAFDSHVIAERANAIVDTRNALEEVTDPALRDKIILLGGGDE